MSVEQIGGVKLLCCSSLSCFFYAYRVRGMRNLLIFVASVVVFGQAEPVQSNNEKKKKEVFEIYRLRRVLGDCLHMDRIANLKRDGKLALSTLTEEMLSTKAYEDVHKLVNLTHSWLTNGDVSVDTLARFKRAWAGFERENKECEERFCPSAGKRFLAMERFLLDRIPRGGFNYRPLSVDLLDRETVLATISSNVYFDMREIARRNNVKPRGDKVWARRVGQPLADAAYRMMRDGEKLLASNYSSFVEQYLKLMRRPSYKEEGFEDEVRDLGEVVVFSITVEGYLAVASSERRELVRERRMMEGPFDTKTGLTRN